MTSTEHDTLAARLDELAADDARNLDVESLRTIDAAVKQLGESGITDNALAVGDTAPAFVLPNSHGQLVRLTSLLAEGPVVVSFFRGGWCPYCVHELRELQKNLPLFLERSARLLAISPQSVESNRQLAEQLDLEFEVLSDAGNVIARRFGLVFVMPESLRGVYAKSGVDIPSHNGEDSFELPIPASFVIASDRGVRLAYVNTDHRQRASMATLLATLPDIRSK